mmetsp:Transcript_36840/g.78179  ORF Transcript_36840/g.78179 Transcript_36840/m.78179 type:complete len:207 (-) Transcript_36840:1062-1682(-)
MTAADLGRLEIAALSARRFAKVGPDLLQDRFWVVTLELHATEEVPVADVLAHDLASWQAPLRWVQRCFVHHIALLEMVDEQFQDPILGISEACLPREHGGTWELHVLDVPLRDGWRSDKLREAEELQVLQCHVPEDIGVKRPGSVEVEVRQTTIEAERVRHVINHQGAQLCQTDLRVRSKPLSCVQVLVHCCKPLIGRGKEASGIG